MKRLALLLSLAAVAVLGWSGSALAASVNMWQDSGGGLHVQYKADTGETNNVTVSSCGIGCFDVTDPGASIAAGWGIFMSYGCKSIAKSSARCTAPVGIAGVEAALGDQDDRLTIAGNVSPGLITMIGGGAGMDALIGGPSIDNLYGNDDDDVLFPAGGPCNVVSGQAGNDTLVSGIGADILSGGTGTDTADYSARTAHVFVSIDLTLSTGSCNGSGIGNDGELGENDNVNEDVENVKGGSGDDSLYGNALDNRLEGGAGNDILDGKGGADALIGDDGMDRADYTSRSAWVDVLLDGTANDGEPGEGDNVDTENVFGGDGADHLTGDAKANILSGGPGNDKLDGGLGADLLSGGDGADVVDYSSRTSAVHVTLDDSGDDGTWNAGSGVSLEGDNVLSDVEHVIGGSGNDTLVGSSAANELHGADGNDTIRGGGGQDTLSGDGNDDELHVDDGDVNDSVTCGAGIDSVYADTARTFSGWISDAVAADCESTTWKLLGPWSWPGPWPVLGP